MGENLEIKGGPNPLIAAVRKQGGIFGKEFSNMKDQERPECAVKSYMKLVAGGYSYNNLDNKIQVLASNKKEPEKADYRTAFQMAKDAGSELPSNVLHDHYLVETDLWTQLSKNYYPAWCRELIACAGKDQSFVKGQDIVDSARDWVLPASYIPYHAFTTPHCSLFIDPLYIGEENSKIIIHPRIVIVLAGYPPLSGQNGKLDDITRMPVAASSSELISLPHEQIRSLFYDPPCLRPIVRKLDFVYDNDGRGKRLIFADYGPWENCGVGLAVPKE